MFLEVVYASKKEVQPWKSRFPGDEPPIFKDLIPKEELDSAYKSKSIGQVRAEVERLIDTFTEKCLKEYDEVKENREIEQGAELDKQKRYKYETIRRLLNEAKNDKNRKGKVRPRRPREEEEEEYYEEVIEEPDEPEEPEEDEPEPEPIIIEEEVIVEEDE